MADILNVESFEELSSLMQNIDTEKLPICVDPSASLDMNLAYGVYMLGSFENTFSQVQAVANHSVRSYSRSSEFRSPDSADRYAKKLCRFIKTIKFLTTLTTQLAQMLEEVNTFMYWCLNQVLSKAVDITDDMIQFILGKTQILSLRIKEFILMIKIKIAKCIKKILQGINSKKGSWMSTAIAAAVQGILTAFKALAQAAYYILVAIDVLLKALPPMISLDGESMAFFMTPRSAMTGMLKTSITAANANMSITVRLPQALCMSLSTLFDATHISNAALKVSIIAAGAAIGAATAYNDFNVPNSVCKAMNMLDANAIIEKINTILKTFVMPYPLPKYEELLPANLGFLAFLMTGFCPSGHIAFGFPGCP